MASKKAPAKVAEQNQAITNEVLSALGKRALEAMEKQAEGMAAVGAAFSRIATAMEAESATRARALKAITDDALPRVLKFLDSIHVNENGPLGGAFNCGCNVRPCVHDTGREIDGG